MTRDEFKQLQVDARVTHPAFAGVLVIATVEVSYDYTTRPPTPWTDAIILRQAQDRLTTNGRRMKACGERSRTIGDTRDVALLQRAP